MTIAPPDGHAVESYLFQAGDTDLYALSTDKNGANLPNRSEQWFFVGDFTQVDFEDQTDQVFEELSEYGYCLLQADPLT